jgi:glycosidase
LQEIIKESGLIGIDKHMPQLGDINGLQPPKWVLEGPIYEIFVRNFTTVGTLKAVENRLAYIKNLGIKTIWLMPVHPIGQMDRKGRRGSPYAISDYYEIDASLGTKDDLKSLIIAVHRNGMKIILDIVANHAANDHIWLNENPDWFINADKGNVIRKPLDWIDVTDLNYENKELTQQMKKMIRYWVEEFDIDGYRCDVAGLVPTDFWEDVYHDLIKIKSDIFLLAEWESANLHSTAFHATYDWSAHFVLWDIYKGRRLAKEVVNWVLEKEANYPRNALPMRFTENHDLDRTREKFGENSFYPFVVFNFVLYGLPLIYCGQEIGLRDLPSLFEKDPVDWDKTDRKILGFYKKLISIRQNNPSLSSREMYPIENDKSDQIVTMIKSDKASKILIVLNFSDQHLTTNIEPADFYHNNDKFEDLYSGKRVNRSELREFEIKPYGFYLFQSTNYPLKPDQALTDTN